MKTNQDYKNAALAALKGNWGKAVLLILLYAIVVCLVMGPVTYTSAELQAYTREHAGSGIYAAVSMIQDPAYQLIANRLNGTSGLLSLAEIFLLFPLTVGIANAFRKLLTEGDNNLVDNAVRISFHGYLHKVGGMLWMQILIILWSFLLIIPGIIKSFSYAMTPYILEENPELSITESIHRSRMMMRGHKYDLFWLYLSFIGWGILSILTLGIGLLWLAPYMETAQAAFYEDVKADYALHGGLD